MADTSFFMSERDCGLVARVFQTGDIASLDWVGVWTDISGREN
jgi:hypothetical protein